jgi:hypothetical protein
MPSGQKLTSGLLATITLQVLTFHMYVLFPVVLSFLKCIMDVIVESIIVPVHKKGDKTDCNNYRGISLLSTSYKMLFNILLSRLNP